jgi:hypothetical protein
MRPEYEVALQWGLLICEKERLVSQRFATYFAMVRTRAERWDASRPKRQQER